MKNHLSCKLIFYTKILLFYYKIGFIDNNNNFNINLNKELYEILRSIQKIDKNIELISFF
jgi:hypothetical protein